MRSRWTHPLSCGARYRNHTSVNATEAGAGPEDDDGSYIATAEGEGQGDLEGVEFDTAT